MVSVRPNIPPLGNYNISQTARILGQCRATIRKMAKAGRLKASFNRDAEMFFTGRDILKYFDLKFKPV